MAPNVLATKDLAVEKANADNVINGPQRPRCDEFGVCDWLNDSLREIRYTRGTRKTGLTYMNSLIDYLQSGASYIVDNKRGELIDKNARRGKGWYLMK